MSLLLLGELQKLSQGGGDRPEEGSNIHFPWGMQCRDFLLPLTMLFPLLLWSMTRHGPGGSIPFWAGTCTMLTAIAKLQTFQSSSRPSRNKAKPPALETI